MLSLLLGGGIMHDWNGNGKDDLFDRSVDYEIISGDEKKNDAKPEDKPKASPQTGGEVLGAVVIAVCIILFIVGIIVF